MNCEQCQQLISVYLDNELEKESSMEVQSHLAVCAACAKVCQDFAMILDFCLLDETPDFVPPNSKALWCRINNIIETEIKPEIAQEKVEEQIKTGRFRWQFSFSQVFAAVLGIALISSLLTIVSVKNYSAHNESVSGNTSPTFVEKVLGKIGLAQTPEQVRENRIKEQQATIEYWNKRASERRANWDKNLRDVFDRNLTEINQVVFEYNKILQENPQDELTGEMLDSALNEKAELLREFSEL